MIQRTELCQLHTVKLPILFPFLRSAVSAPDAMLRWGMTIFFIIVTRSYNNNITQLKIMLKNFADIFHELFPWLMQTTEAKLEIFSNTT